MSQGVQAGQGVETFAAVRTVVGQPPGTRLAVEAATGRCLGGVAANWMRPWVFPLYTPAGGQVLQEFPPDHPFHNGIFVAESPVAAAGREAVRFWCTGAASPADRERLGPLGTVALAAPPAADPTPRGVRFTLAAEWRDADGAPLLAETRTVHLWRAAGGDATFCDVESALVCPDAPVRYGPGKQGGIGVRIEPRLLPPLGGRILGDGGRKGSAALHERDAGWLAYEASPPAVAAPFGVLLTAAPWAARGPWFVRDYGLALLCPALREAGEAPTGAARRTGLRVVAYDGPLTDGRAAALCAEKEEGE